MNSQDEQTELFWQIMFKHEGFKNYYYSIRSEQTRKALRYLIVDIQRGLRENSERIRDLHYSELKKTRVRDEKEYARKRTPGIENENVWFGYEQALVRTLHKLEEIGVLSRYSKVEPTTRRHKEGRTKTTWYYCLDHRGMAWAPFEPEKYLSDFDKLLARASKVYQKLNMAKEIGIEAYIELGKTADDFDGEYRKRTEKLEDYNSEGYAHQEE
jgi:hypothetical protein